MVLAALAAVAVTLPFNEALQGVRTQVLATQKSLADASQIQNLSRDVRNAEWTASRLRNRLSDIRFRARRPNDPFLRNEVQRLVWDLRDFSRELWRHETDARRLAQSAQKDPELVAPAEDLDRNARSLRSETRWLETDGRWAASDLRRLGLSMEAWDIERETGDVERYSRDLESDARSLLNKVR